MELLTLDPEYTFEDGGDPMAPNSWIRIDFYPTNIVGMDGEPLSNYCEYGNDYEVLGRTAQQIIDANIATAAANILASLQETEFADRFYYE